MIKKILVAALILVVMGFVATYVMDSYVKYDWSKRQYGDVNSTDPFGAYYLKEHLETTWKGGVETDTVLTDALQKREGKRYNYIVYSTGYEYEDFFDERQLLLNALQRGDNVILVGENCDLLQMFNVNSYTQFSFDISYVSKRGEHYDHKKLLLNKNRTGCEAWSFLLEKTYSVSTYTDEDEFDKDVERLVSQTREVLTDTGGQTYVLQRKLKKGSMTFAGYQALFSNYAISDTSTCKLMDDVLNKVLNKENPVVLVRHVAPTETDSSNNEGELDPTYQVLLNHKGSALAIYILLAALVLLLIVNGRRRRAAAIDEPMEHNSTISFIKHLATLYDLNSDYTDLLKIEQRNLLYRLRKEYRFDYTTKDFNKPSDYADHIARSKQLDVNMIREALLQMESLTAAGSGNLPRKAYITCLKNIEKAMTETKV